MAEQRVSVPSRARQYYKAVAVVGGELLSIFDGATTYSCGQLTHRASGTSIWAPPPVRVVIECRVCLGVQRRMKVSLRALFGPKIVSLASFPSAFALTPVRLRVSN